MTSKSVSWTDPMRGALISQFQYNECLWNTTNKDYRNIMKKRKIIREIAKRISSDFGCSIQVSNLNKQWQSLRDQYRRAKKKLEIATVPTKPWRFLQSLMFTDIVDSIDLRDPLVWSDPLSRDDWNEISEDAQDPSENSLEDATICGCIKFEQATKCIALACEPDTFRGNSLKSDASKGGSPSDYLFPYLDFNSSISTEILEANICTSHRKCSITRPSINFESEIPKIARQFCMDGSDEFLYIRRTIEKKLRSIARRSQRLYVLTQKQIMDELFEAEFKLFKKSVCCKLQG